MNAVELPRATGPSVRIVGKAAFEALRADWTRLVQSMPSPTPFATWEWAEAWLATIGRETEVRFVLLENGAQLRGILPLVSSLVRGPIPHMRMLTTCAVDRVYPDQLEPIVSSTDLPVLLEYALREIWSDDGRWIGMRLPMIAEDSATFGELQRLSAGRLTQSTQVLLAPYLPVSGSFDEFLGRLSSNERYKIRSRSKKLLTGQGATYGDPQLGAVEALQVLRRLHARRSEQKGIRSTFDTDEVQRFHERLVETLPREQLVLRCLRKDTEIFAMFYGFRFANRLFYFQLGYEPAWSDFSPGLVLLSQTIREAFESGCREYNFLQGDEPFKSTWTKSARRLYDWTVFRPGVLGRLYRDVGRMRRTVRAGIRHLRRLDPLARGSPSSAGPGKRAATPKD